MISDHLRGSFSPTTSALFREKQTPFCDHVLSKHKMENLFSPVFAERSGGTVAMKQNKQKKRQVNISRSGNSANCDKWQKHHSSHISEKQHNYFMSRSFLFDEKSALTICDFASERHKSQDFVSHLCEFESVNERIHNRGDEQKFNCHEIVEVL